MRARPTNATGVALARWSGCSKKRRNMTIADLAWPTSQSPADLHRILRQSGFSDITPQIRRMTRTLAVLMDPIAAIHPEKDTTLAMLLEAQRRGYQLLYMTHGDLALRDGNAWARLAPLSVRDTAHDWFTLGAADWRRFESRC